MKSYKNYIDKDQAKQLTKKYISEHIRTIELYDKSMIKCFSRIKSSAKNGERKCCVDLLCDDSAINIKDYRILVKEIMSDFISLGYVTELEIGNFYSSSLTIKW